MSIDMVVRSAHYHTLSHMHTGSNDQGLRNSLASKNSENSLNSCILEKNL